MMRRFRNRRAERTDCHPPGMRPTDPPAKQAYDWGRLDRNTDEPPQPENHPGHEGDYGRGYDRLRRQWRHRRPLRHRFRRPH